MNKKLKNTGMSSLIHGADSKTVKDLQERLKMLPLDDVRKIEFESMLAQMESTSWAFDFDRTIKAHLVANIKETDKKIMSYTADLWNSQLRLAKLQKDAAFHEKVLQDLKADYLDCNIPDEKRKIYIDIQECEKTLSSFENKVQSYIDLRNKIRKAIDSGQYKGKSLKLKEEALAGQGAKPVDVDFSVLDDIE